MYNEENSSLLQPPEADHQGEQTLSMEVMKQSSKYKEPVIMGVNPDMSSITESDQLNISAGMRNSS